MQIILEVKGKYLVLVEVSTLKGNVQDNCSVNVLATIIKGYVSLSPLFVDIVTLYGAFFYKYE